MPTILPWLPTIVAVITAALALGGAKSELTAIRADLAETRAEYKALVVHVQETLTAKAVTQLHLETLRADVEALKASRLADTEVRHRLRDEVLAQIARVEARIDTRRA